MKIGQWTTDWKIFVGVIAGIAGWIVTNGQTIVPTIPVPYQKAAGTIVSIAAAITLILSEKPTKEKP